MITDFPTRRLACAWLAAAFLLPAGCTSPFRRQPLSPPSCQDVDRVKHVSEPDGLQRFELVDFADVAERQTEKEWCWAACATMIHRWQHDDMTQEQIVERIRARVTDDEDASDPAATDEEAQAERLRAASEHEILLALAPDRKDLLDLLWDQFAFKVGEALGEQLVAQTDEERTAAEQKLAEELAKALVTGLSYLSNTMDLDTVLADLQDGHPVVVGLQLTDDDGTSYGHACVIYGLTATWRVPDGVMDGVAAMGNAFLGTAGTGYGFKGESGYTYLTALILDPDGEQPKAIEMSVAELMARADFFASRPFAERVLDSEAQSLQQPASGDALVAAGPDQGGSP